jgi:hypothetical protein
MNMDCYKHCKINSFVNTPDFMIKANQSAASSKKHAHFICGEG